MRILPIRSIAATSLAAVLIAGLAACGGDDETDTAATTPDSGTSAGTNPDTGTETGTAALTAQGHRQPVRRRPHRRGAHADEREGHRPPASSRPPRSRATADSEAADLRSDLTYLLTEHVYLAGIAVATAYHAGADSDAFKLAAATLDENSKAVAAAVGSVAPDEEKGFLAAWRSHVNDFVTYAVGAKTGGAKGAKLKKTAVANLTAYAKARASSSRRSPAGR